MPDIAAAKLAATILRASAEVTTSATTHCWMCDRRSWTAHRTTRRAAPLSSRLGAGSDHCYRAEMYALGRLLQLVGLTILPLAVVSEITGREPNPGLLLKFMLM